MAGMFPIRNNTGTCEPPVKKKSWTMPQMLTILRFSASTTRGLMHLVNSLQVGGKEYFLELLGLALVSNNVHTDRGIFNKSSK